MVFKDHKSLVEVTNLSVEFRTKDLVISAVENISFSIQKSEILALVGESGSGQSLDYGSRKCRHTTVELEPEHCHHVESTAGSRTQSLSELHSLHL